MGVPKGFFPRGLSDIKPEYGDEKLNKAIDEQIARQKRDTESERDILRRMNRDADALVLRSKGIVRK